MKSSYKLGYTFKHPTKDKSVFKVTKVLDADCVTVKNLFTGSVIKLTDDKISRYIECDSHGKALELDEAHMRKIGVTKFLDQNFRSYTSSGREKDINFADSAVGRNKIVAEAFEMAPEILKEFSKPRKKEWVKLLMQHPNFLESTYDNIPDHLKMSAEHGMAGIIITVLSVCMSTVSIGMKGMKVTTSVRHLTGRQVGKVLFWKEEDPDKRTLYGLALAESILERSKFIERVNKVDTAKDTDKYVTKVTFELSKDLDEYLENYLISMMPSQLYPLPLTKKPQDWRFTPEYAEDSGDVVNYKLSGGFEDINEPLIKTSPNKGIGKVDPLNSEKLLDSVNYLQSIPYRINKRLFYEAEESIKGTFPKKSDFIVKIGDTEKCDDPRYQSARGKYIRKKIILKYLKEYIDAERFWQLYQLDYRGRVYTMSSIVTTISDDFGKSLVEFADGYTLIGDPSNKNVSDEDDGWNWAYASLASLKGDDKLLFKDRVINGREYFESKPKDIDEPWQYRALEVAMLDAKDGEDIHVSVPFDASTSGWQFLSLICHSREGMKKTNLLDNSKRYDLYLEVAEATVNEVTRLQAMNTQTLNGMYNSKAFEDGDEEVQEVVFKLEGLSEEYSLMLELMHKPGMGRKLAKTPTMTQVYSATRGNSQRIVQGKVMSSISEFKDEEEENLYKNVGRKLGGIIHDMVNTAVPGASAYQKAVRAVVMNIYKDEGRAAVWTTPDGLTCINSKPKTSSKYSKVPVVGTGRERRRQISMTTPVLDDEGLPVLSGEKMANGASPNTIHTVDAYFLRQVVVTAYEMGIHKLVTIHDSFSCDLNNCRLFNRILREVLVKIMTSGDIQKMFRNMGFEVPVIDEMGSKEFEAILDNPYCFA